MADSARNLFYEAESIPYGAARVAALETAMRAADADGTDELLPFEVRFDLIYSYISAGERARSFVPFAWCVTEFDRDPAKYADFQEQLLWAFKWQPTGLTDFPEIPLGRTLDFIDDMERRYRTTGHSLFAVHQVRLSVARHLGDSAAAARHFRDWEISVPDSLADCAGCWPSAKVEYLVDEGRYDDALRIADPVLQGALTCHEQPQWMLTALLPAYIATGRLEDAADAFRKAYRIDRTRRASLDRIGEQIEFLARTGNEVAALDIVEDHLNWLEDPDSPRAAMVFSASAALALSRLEPGFTVGRGAAARPAAELAEELATSARAIAARFDLRNGNDVMGREIDALLVAQPWVDYLPLSSAARKALQLQERLAGLIHTEPERAERSPVETVNGADLLDRFEDAWWDEDSQDAEAALARFENAVTEPERDGAQQGRVLEARGLLAALRDPEEALRIWGEALEVLSGAREDLRVRRTRARIGRVLLEVGRADESRATSEEPLRWLVEHDEEKRRPGWTITLARVLAEDEPRQADALLSALRSGGLDIPHTAQAAFAHARVLDVLEDRGRLITALDTIIGLVGAPGLHPQLVINAYGRRGVLHLEEGRPHDAVSDLAEARSWVSVAYGGASSPQVLHDLAAAYLTLGDAEAAAECGEESLRVLTNAGDVEGLVIPRRILFDAYWSTRDWELALEQARALQGLESAEFIPYTHEQEGRVLERMDQDAAAVDVFLRAASLYAEAGDRIGEARSLRRAAESSIWIDEHDEGVDLRARATKVLDGVDGDEADFQRAGLLLDEAVALDRIGIRDRPGPLLDRAAELFRRVGAEENARDCLLRAVEFGAPPDETVLSEIHEQSEPGTPMWGRAGYLLMDLLRAEGRAGEADVLRQRLEEG